MTPLTERELAKSRMYGLFMLLPLMAFLFAWGLWHDNSDVVFIATGTAVFGIYKVVRGRWPREARVGLLGIAGIYAVFVMFHPQLLWPSLAGLAAGLVIVGSARALLWMVRQDADGDQPPQE